ncbi:MAG: hypothetical protein AABY03_02340, partial [Nanoarchaeota archaeon]
MARDKSDVWNVDGLRDRLFGDRVLKAKTYKTPGNNWFNLSISSKRNFDCFSLDEVKDICDTMFDKRPVKNYHVTYTFTGEVKNYLEVREVVQEILSLNRGYKLLNDDSPIVNIIPEVVRDDLPKEEQMPATAREIPKVGSAEYEESVSPDFFDAETIDDLESATKPHYEFPIKTSKGRAIVESVSSLEGNTILYSNQPAGKNILLLSAKSFQYPVNFNGSGIGIKTKP